MPTDDEKKLRTKLAFGIVVIAILGGLLVYNVISEETFASLTGQTIQSSTAP